MDIIEALIKKLEEAKEELSKNINMSYSGDQNVAKDEVKPDKGYGKVTIKDTPKPKGYGSVIFKEEEMEKDSANPALAPKEVKIKKLQAQIDAGTYKPDPKKIADKMVDKKVIKMEDLMCNENGQWMEKAMNPGINSKHIFSMDHIKAAAEHKDHGAAKKMAHQAIDSSSARPENKMKARSMVESSKSPTHLAQGMTNFHMAHDTKIRNRLNGNKD